MSIKWICFGSGFIGYSAISGPVLTSTKGREFEQEPKWKSIQPERRTRTIIDSENCRCKDQLCDGVDLKMNLLSLAAPRVRVRAFMSAIAFFRSHFHGGSQPRPSRNNSEVKQCSEAWFVKVVCSLFLNRHSASDDYLCYLSQNVTPLIAFEAIKRLNNPKIGFRFWEFSRFRLNISHFFLTYNMLIRSLCEVGLQDLAKIVFESMRRDGFFPNSRMLGFLVSSFAEKGKLDFARELLNQSFGVEGSSFVVNGFLNTLVRMNRIDDTVSVFEEHLRFQSCLDTWTFNILIRGLCGVGNVEKALELFGDMGNFGCTPDIVTFNTLIKGLCKVCEVGRANDLLNQAKSRHNCSPDVVTYTSMISGYSKLGKMQEASLLLDEMIRCGIIPNVITFNVLIDGFGKVGDMVSAESMCMKMPSFGCSPDVVTFTSMIDGYCRAGQVNQSFRLWNEMNTKGLSPNVYTYSIVINALCKESRLYEACDLLKQLTYKNIIPKPFMYNPVIDGFCKAGNVDEANEIVVDMKRKRCNPDKVTFTILIIGHCVKGRMFEAISIFNKMLAIGCSPDDITVSSLISRLLKAGMTKEAFKLKQMASTDLNEGFKLLNETGFLRKITDVPVAA